MSDKSTNVKIDRPPDSRLHYLSIREASELIRGRKLSPVELTRAFLRRIESLDLTLQSYITVLPELAMSEARRAETEIQHGDYRGPLHGIPVALKDVYDVAGIRTTAGSRLMIDRVATEDATAWRNLKNAGAILLGKNALYELALGGPDFGIGFPVARNPWDVERVPGGSSSGSAAAVAAGLCMGSLGTCTGGSIRGPASYTGIVGLKPTYGRVSRHGIVPLAPTLDHCGILTRTVEDAAMLLDAVAGHDPNDRTTNESSLFRHAGQLAGDVQGLRIGVPRHFVSQDSVRDDVLSAFGVALEALIGAGALVKDIRIPMLDRAASAQQVIMLAEAFAHYKHDLDDRPDDFGEVPRARLRAGERVAAADYAEAHAVGASLTKQLSDVFDEVNVVAMPTMPTTAPRFEEFDVLRPSDVANFTRVFNMTGMPAMSVPCGVTADRLPVGFQVAGRRHDESTVLRVAHALERSGLADVRPAI